MKCCVPGKPRDNLPSGTAEFRGSNSDIRAQPLFTLWVIVLLGIGSLLGTGSGHLQLPIPAY